ncbi:MAG: alcohol dehydrogenase catalytic domain-containing protein [Rhodobacter sp.]|nr:alcohol dehydrogenase catalytic domain-containing protein [Paracoccaceae bacterium]MCC0075276.1 alcohol dehydrogenase catalytic domain-containing protein [Rhodobacter sp.]
MSRTAEYRWAVTAPGAALEHVAVPDRAPLGPTEVLLDVTHCGVCHSDVHFWEGFVDVGDRKVPVAALGIETPYTLGHEVVGRVVETGAQVTDCKPGDLRLVYPWIGCGTCEDCLRGDDNLCVASRAIGLRRAGGFADRVLVPDARYLFDIDGIDPSMAATYACAGLTVYSAIAKLMPLSPDAPLVLIGAGGLGQSALAILRAKGHRNTLVVEPREQGRADALAAGARLTFDPADPQVASLIAAQAGGPVKSVIDLVNSPQTATLALGLLQKGGRLVMVGLYGGAISLPLGTIPVRGISIIGNYTGSPAELGALLDLARSGLLPPIPVTHRPPQEVTAALTDLRDGRVRGRIVLTSQKD